MAKIKIQKQRIELFEILGKEFKMSNSKVGSIIIEQGFDFLALISHGNEKTIEVLDKIYRKEATMMKFINKLDECVGNITESEIRVSFKINKHLKKLISLLVDEFSYSEEYIIDFIIDKSIKFLTNIPKGDDKVIDYSNEIREDNDAMRIINKLREWWEAGAEK